MQVEVVIGWPRRYRAVALELQAGARVRDAIVAAALKGADDVIGYAIHGRRATLADVLNEGDRVELLRALQADPMDARRRRASSSKKI